MRAQQVRVSLRRRRQRGHGLPQDAIGVRRHPLGLVLDPLSPLHLRGRSVRQWVSTLGLVLDPY